MNRFSRTFRRRLGRGFVVVTVLLGGALAYGVTAPLVHLAADPGAGRDAVTVPATARPAPGLVDSRLEASTTWPAFKNYDAIGGAADNAGAEFIMPACTTNGDCDDLVGCTDDTCPAGECVYTPNDSLCDDGLWCTGAETCDALLDCRNGTPPCKDGVVCTIDNCDEGTHACDNVPDDALCDDGLWCTGAETCDAQIGCLTPTPPCTDGVYCTVDNCDEGTHDCDSVPDDTRCADVLWCNGVEWCDAVSDCQPGSDPCPPAQTCDEDGDRCLGVVGSVSCRDHAAAGRLCLDMGTNGGVEPRSGGIDELEIDLTDASDFAGGVSVICVNAGDVSASVSGTSLNGNTVTVSFSPSLPDQDACTVELSDCEASVCVRGLEGDLDLSGQTNTTDTSQLKVRIGQDAVTAGPQWDFDVSGLVNTTDSSQVKVRFGNTAPACP